MLTRDWNTYSPIKQRWIIYRIIQDVPEGISKSKLRERIHANCGTILSKRALKSYLTKLNRREAIRSRCQDGAVIWESTGNVRTYSKNLP